MDDNLYSIDRLIIGTTVHQLQRDPTDVTALPTGASLIVEADWLTLAEKAGSEDALLAQLEVTYASY